MEAQPTLDAKKLQDFVNQTLEGSVKDSLIEFIKIRNVTKSYYSEEKWNEDSEEGGYNLIKRAGEHIAAWVTNLQLKGAKVTLFEHTDKSITPAILTEIESSGVGSQNDTYFFYGHYDKQPPMEGWTQGGPYEPKVVTNESGTYQIYGRGGADDGYSTYSTMVAIKALQEQGIALPKIVMITQGDQQTGSGDVQHWLDQLTSKFGTPKLIFCLDSGTLDYDRFWLTNSLRGYLVISLQVKVLYEAIHSGSGTGIVPTCFRIVRQLLERIECAKTGVMQPLDLVKIPYERDQQILDLVDKLKEKAITKYPTVPNLKTPSQDIAETIRLNTWKAQLETLAIEGYPDLQNSSNIVTPQIRMKLSIRLPPTKDHLQARKTAVELLTKDPPYNAEVTILSQPSSDTGFDSPANPQELKDVFEAASQAVFGDKYLSMGQGGSIPFMNQLKLKWDKANFIITGLLGPESNAHGPNECLRFDYLKKLTASFAHIIAKSIPVYFPTAQKEAKYGNHHHPQHYNVKHEPHYHEHHEKKHHHSKKKHGHGSACQHLQ